MDFAYINGNSLETESLGTLLRSQSSQNNGGTMSDTGVEGSQTEGECQPQQGGLPNGIGTLLDVTG